STTELFLSAGTHQLNAFPFPGYGFAGWNINGQQLNPYLSTFDFEYSVMITPQFMPAKRVHIGSNPGGMKIIVDATTIQFPPPLPRDQLPRVNIDSACTPDYTRIPVGSPVGIAQLCVGDFDFLPGSQHKLAAPQSQTDDAGLWWVFSGFSNGLGNNSTYIP